MRNNIVIQNLTFAYNKNTVFDNFSLKIKNQNTSIIGSPASGKTTLCKLLAGVYYDKSINIFGEELKPINIKNIRNNLAVVLNEFTFVAETVLDELTFGMENQNVEKIEMRKQIEEVMEMFDITNIINSDPNSLASEDKALVKMLSFALAKPKMIIIDDLVSYLSKEKKNILFKYLNKYKIKFVNITSQIEDTLYANNIIVLNEGKVAIEGKTKSVLNEELLLKRLGFNLPFIVDLSKQLIAYELIDKIYYDDKELIGDLWK